MKDGIIRVAVASPEIKVASPKENVKLFIDCAENAAAEGAKLIAFPELSLTSATCGDLYFQSALTKAAEDALSEYINATAELDLVSVIGLPVRKCGRLYNLSVAVSAGKLIAATPLYIDGESRYFTNGEDFTTAITLVGQSVPFGKGIGLSLTDKSGKAHSDIKILMSVGDFVGGADIVINAVASPELVGAADYRRAKAKTYSRDNSCAYIYAGAGVGESGTDFVFSGHKLIAQGGRIIAEAAPFSGKNVLYAEIDTEICAYERAKRGVDASGLKYIPVAIDFSETEIRCPVRRLPFVPEDKGELDERLKLILEIQANGLAARIRRSYSRCAVVGVSGGLDSTLTMLVMAKAMDILGRDRKNIIAVTMPAFGTTNRTKSNAQKLAESLGATFRVIDIKNAVNVHFLDIGHPTDKYDVVYENAQARERTQVLMDLANAEGGLVVGTGDLSELALGFATYNGDHMSMYATNAGIPKTLMRYIVAYAAEEYGALGNSEAKEALVDILNTPVSPELLPPTDGEISQCTEGIVGPYELHDYFLYYTVRYGFSPRKILRMAKHSFAGVYDEDTVKGWLKIFVRRFFAQQFKRSCLPDGPKVGSVSFSPRGEWVMPSDADADIWLRELD